MFCMNTQEQVAIFKVARVAIILLSIFLAFQILLSVKDWRATSPSYNSITVSGEGEVVAVPDVSSFSFGVSSDAKTVNVAQDAVTNKIDAIVDKMKEMGIEEKDIKTSDYSVYPKYSYKEVSCITVPCSPQQSLDGYTVSHTITVKVRKVDDAGRILALVGENGATNVSGISFTIDDPEKLLNEAREKAIKNAREKAEVLADDLDVRLVRIVSFSDSWGGVAMYREAYGVGGDGVAFAQKAPTIPVGENDIKVTVNVTYEIR